MNFVGGEEDGETWGRTNWLGTLQTPRHIDFGQGDKNYYGIYEVEGDTLKMLIADEGENRPASFDSVEHACLYVFKKAD